MSDMKENKLSAVYNWLFVGLATLLPVFFIPYITNPLFNSKLILFFSLAFLTIFGFIISSWRRKSWTILRTPLTWPLVIFAGLITISGLVSHQYPTKQFLGMGGVFLSFTSIILLAPSLLKKKYKHWFVLTMNAVAIILSLLSVLQLFDFGLASLINRFSILELPNSLIFALTGATFITIQFLSTILLSNVFDQKKWQSSWFIKISTFIIAIGLGINIWAIFPGGEAAFQSLSLSASASVARDGLAFTKNAMFGYGPDAYGNAYNTLKPVWINGLKYWNFTFDSAFNVPLSLIVSTGVLAFLAYLLFTWKSILVLEKEYHDTWLKTLILASFIWQLFAPINLVMLALLAVSLALFLSSNQDAYAKMIFKSQSLLGSLTQRKADKFRYYLFLISNVVFLSLLGFASYFVGKTFVAYHLLYQSNAYVMKNDVVKAYDYHRRAKEMAFEIDSIRQSYALMNLEIAIALSNKADLKAAEQEQVLQLVNEAIREAKAATILDPYNYQNWLVLAQIYMQLLGSTDQAMQEAFNALAKAAANNPNNPEIRLILGQLFLNAKQATEAANFFSQAIERKPDLFVAYYYLAQAYKANNQLLEARNALVSGMSLLAKDSQEYTLVEKEVNELNAQLESAAKKAEEEQKGTAANSAPAGGTTNNAASESTTLNNLNQANNSGLSQLLDQETTEAVIQDGALTPDQNIVAN